MLRRPALPRPQGGGQMVAAPRSLPAPVGGWNAKDSLAAMPVKDAVRLENWIPRAAYVEMRAGSSVWMQSPPAAIETILIYNSNPSGGEERFAVADAEVYDANTEGAAFTSPVYTGVTTSRVQSLNFSNDAGGFLVCVTGQDTPFSYDGGSWAALTITGSSGPITLDPDTLADLMTYQERLYFSEKDSLRVWYLDVSAIQGAASLLDLGAVFDQGGAIVGLGTWSAGRVEGPDEYAVFLTSKGEAAIFSGADPSSEADWSLMGVFDIGTPIGGTGRGLLKTGGELNVLTRTGIVPLGQALARNRADDDRVALTAKIRNAFLQASLQYGSLFGWSGVIARDQGLAIYNVPTEAGISSVQFVQELESGAWCKFTGWDATAWAVSDEGVWYGNAAGLYRAFVGVTDAGADMTAVCVPAFSNFGQAGVTKLFTMAQPIFYVSQEIKPAVEMLTDFADRTPVSQPTTVVDRSTTTELRREWTTVGGVGSYGSPAVAVTVRGDPSSTTTLSDGDGDEIIVGDGDTDAIAVDSGEPLSATVQLIGFNIRFKPGGAY